MSRGNYIPNCAELVSSPKNVCNLIADILLGLSECYYVSFYCLYKNIILVLYIYSSI
nr:MAG TPA: hypothetical protein [Caudoviricetes sp.]